MSLALPAALLFRAVYALNPAVSRSKVVMALQLGGLVLKLALSEVLIFGQMGLPRLGAVGADAAVAAVALSLIGYFAGLHVFDALQGAAAAVLGAYRIAVMPMLIYALALWGPGRSAGTSSRFVRCSAKHAASETLADADACPRGGATLG